MVLHRSNFEIPARFTFQPHSAKWEFATAETVEWVEEPKLRPLFYKEPENPEKPWVQIRVGPSFSYGGLDTLYGEDFPSFTVPVSRASIPSDVLQSHETYSNTPDISGRSFTVLICRDHRLKDGLLRLKPQAVTKNAWIMRDEFLRLESDPVSGWGWSVRQFLDKWGFWGNGQVYVEGWAKGELGNLTNLLRLAGKAEQRNAVIVMPHLLREQQESYRKALLPSHARAWLRSHPLYLETADEPPFFRVRRAYCTDAIETTITIDHLADRQFGICKRCHTVFEKETRHKKNYCSERCFNAAGVQRWRENQRKAAGKKGKRNAKG